MSDLIDRQAAIKAIYACLIDGEKEVAKYRAGKTLDHFTHALSDAIDAVEDLPPAEKRGKWIGVSPMVDTLMCSECGGNIIDEEFITPYCPYCGAKMEEE